MKSQVHNVKLKILYLQRYFEIIRKGHFLPGGSIVLFLSEPYSIFAYCFKTCIQLWRNLSFRLKEGVSLLVIYLSITTPCQLSIVAPPVGHYYHFGTFCVRSHTSKYIPEQFNITIYKYPGCLLARKWPRTP